MFLLLSAAAGVACSGGQSAGPAGSGGGSTSSSSSGASSSSGSTSSTGSSSGTTTGTSSSSSSGSGSACSGCARDWTAYPPIAQVDGVGELWVVSDVHGDYGAITKLLAAANIMPSAPAMPSMASWSGGTAALVVVGDLIDKGPDAPDVVRLFATLQTQAEAAGGHVVVTMGNHEAEFLADPTNSKASASNGIDPELQAIGLTPQQTAAGQDDIGAFLRNLPFAARVDDWFFVHAGNTNGQSLSALAGALQSGVDAMGFGAPILSDPTSMLETKLNNSAPQWWDATSDPTTLLTQWTSALGAKHLVMGHQPGAFAFADGSKRAQDELYKAYGGLLFLIDTGLSVDVDATGGALLHVQGAGTASETYEEVLPTGKAMSL
jgi:hypothetical protein